METNIGPVDQAIRIIVMIIAGAVFLLNRETEFVSTISGALVIYCFITSLTRYSPVWDLFGISTEKEVKQH